MDPLFLLMFIVLILGGQIGLPAVLLTLAFSRRVNRRTATFVNFLICVVELSTALLLPFYSGAAISGNPSFVFCRFQSALVHASGPLLGTAALALNCDALDLISHKSHTQKSSPGKLALLVMPPWLVFLGFFIAFFDTGLHISPEAEELSFRAPDLYCRFPPSLLKTLSDSVTIAGPVCVVGVEVAIAIKLRQHFAQAKAIGTVLPVPFLHLLLRGLIFSYYCMITLCIVLLLDHFNVAVAQEYFILSTLPLTTFVLFGTQKDLLGVWFPCFFTPHTHEVDAVSPPFNPTAGKKSDSVTAKEWSSV